MQTKRSPDCDSESPCHTYRRKCARQVCLITKLFLNSCFHFQDFSISVYGNRNSYFWCIIKGRSLILPDCHSELVQFFDLRIRESKKKLEGVGNQNYTETHLTAMSIDQKDNSFVGFVQNDNLVSYKSRVIWKRTSVSNCRNAVTLLNWKVSKMTKTCYFSNKLHSFGLTTHTIEADFVASKVINFQETSQFASRAWNKHTEMLFHREYQYKNFNQNSKRITLWSPKSPSWMDCSAG